MTLTDYFSNPVAGKTIGLKALNGSSSVTTVNAVTSQTGQATFTVTDSTAEIVTYQATDITDGCGASVFPGGLILLGSDNAATRIVEDLGAEKWWPTPEKVLRAERWVSYDMDCSMLTQG